MRCICIHINVTFIWYSFCKMNQWEPFLFLQRNQESIFLYFFGWCQAEPAYHTGMRKSSDALLFIIVLCCSCCWLLMMVLLHQEHVEPQPALHEIEHHVMLASNKHHAELHAAPCFAAFGTPLDKKKAGGLLSHLPAVSSSYLPVLYACHSCARMLHMYSGTCCTCMHLLCHQAGLRSWKLTDQPSCASDTCVSSAS